MASNCDCGNATPDGVDICERCAWLDGVGAEGQLISELRALGEFATMEALVKEMVVSDRTVFRYLSKLRATGRIDAIADHDDVGDVRCKPKRIKKTRASVCGRGAIVTYILKNTRKVE